MPVWSYFNLCWFHKSLPLLLQKKHHLCLVYFEFNKFHMGFTKLIGFSVHFYQLIPIGNSFPELNMNLCTFKSNKQEFEFAWLILFWIPLYCTWSNAWWLLSNICLTLYHNSLRIFFHMSDILFLSLLNQISF